MALHHNASNMHLSLTHCTSPVLKRYCNNSCQMCARCHHCVKTTGGLWLKGVRMKHVSPVQMALVWVLGGGTVLPLSSIGSCNFMPSCKGDCASLRHLLRALSPVHIIHSPVCWSVPTLSGCMYANQSIDMPVDSSEVRMTGVRTEPFDQKQADFLHQKLFAAHPCVVFHSWAALSYYIKEVISCFSSLKTVELFCMQGFKTKSKLSTKLLGW